MLYKSNCIELLVTAVVTSSLLYILFSSNNANNKIPPLLIPQRIRQASQRRLVMSLVSHLQGDQTVNSEVLSLVLSQYTVEFRYDNSRPIISNRSSLLNSLTLSQDSITLTNALLEKYVNVIGLMLEGSLDNSFLEFDGSNAANFGERIHGMVSSFYLAFATHRVFHVRRNSLFGRFFLLNNALYNVSQSLYTNQLANGYQDALTAFKDGVYATEDNEKSFASRATLTSETDAFRIVSIKSKSLAGLEGALENPSFARTFGELFNSKTPDVLTLVSAALRTLLGRPNHEMSDAFQNCVVSQVGTRQKWDESLKIGVHLNSDNIIQCSAEKLPTFLRKKSKKGVVVFVSSQHRKLVEAFRRKLGSSVAVIESSNECKLFKPFKPDGVGNRMAENVTDEWWKLMKPMLDWWSLTQMNNLVIEEDDNFGESASLFSVSPTQRISC